MHPCLFVAFTCLSFVSTLRWPFSFLLLLLSTLPLSFCAFLLSDSLRTLTFAETLKLSTVGKTSFHVNAQRFSTESLKPSSMCTVAFRDYYQSLFGTSSCSLGRKRLSFGSCKVFKFYLWKDSRYSSTIQIHETLLNVIIIVNASCLKAKTARSLLASKAHLTEPCEASCEACAACGAFGAWEELRETVASLGPKPPLLVLVTGSCFISWEFLYNVVWLIGRW